MSEESVGLKASTTERKMKVRWRSRSMFVGCRSKIIVVVLGTLLAMPAVGGDAAAISKLRAKFSAKKIVVKGKLVASGEWPVILRVELMDAQENVVASASDSLRGAEAFQIELTPARGKKFEREELANARVRYSVMRERKRQNEETVQLAEICPNLVKKKRWWW